MRICPKLRGAIKKYSEKHNCEMQETAEGISIKKCGKKEYTCPHFSEHGFLESVGKKIKTHPI